MRRSHFSYQQRRKRANAPHGFWQDKTNHRRFLDWAAKHLGINRPDDWYRVTIADIDRLGGRGLISNYYKNSVIQAVTAVYPEHEWLPWRFTTVPVGFWKDIANHRRFFDWVGKQLGVKQMPDDWYAISGEDVRKLNGAWLLDGYYGSHIHALTAVYPEYEWLPWKFVSVPMGFWKDKANHRRFLDWAAAQLGVKHVPDDWYSVNKDDLERLGGSRILGLYNNSHIHTLAAVYPEHEWLPWRFKNVSRNFWEDKQNHKRFFDWAGQQLGVKRVPDDWYGIIKEDLERLGGNHLIQSFYDGSFSKALSLIYPEHEWLPWKFRMVPKGFWDDKSNHKWFLDWAAAQLGISPEEPEGWYAIGREDIGVLGGYQLLDEYYGCSLIKALAAVYPEYQLDPWRFQRCQLPKDETVDETVLRRFVEGTLAVQMKVHHLDDWYRVSVNKARRAIDGYATIVDRHGGLLMVLKRLYPQHPWDEERMRERRGKKSAQRLLKVLVQGLFPGTELFEEYHHPDLRFSSSGIAMTLDIWLPALSLALEYQGEQHYHDVYAIGDNPGKQKARDAEKLEACRHIGITLVAVPYWWSDGCSAEDLAATIAAARPDLCDRYPELTKAAAKGSPFSRTQHHQQQQQQR